MATHEALGTEWDIARGCVVVFLTSNKPTPTTIDRMRALGHVEAVSEHGTLSPVLRVRVPLPSWDAFVAHVVELRRGGEDVRLYPTLLCAYDCLAGKREWEDMPMYDAITAQPPKRRRRRRH